MSDKLPTLDDVRAAAEKAKAWRPGVYCREDGNCNNGDHLVVFNCGASDCDACLGAQRAVEDINRHVCDAVSYIATLPRDPLIDGDTALTKMSAAEYEARCAARIAHYFAAEPNPVSEFRDAVKEACRA